MAYTFGIFSDPHFHNARILGGPFVAGVNRRCSGIGRAAQAAIERAAVRGCCHVFVTGDIFDSANPSPAVIGEAARALDGPISVNLVPGNHDRSSDEPGHDALAALAAHSNCTVYREPTRLPLGYEGGELLFCPYLPGGKEALAALIEEHRPRIALAHIGILGPGVPPFLAKPECVTTEEVQRWASRGPLRAFLSGDYHSHQHWSLQLGTFEPTEEFVDVVQVGALCQADFGDAPPVGRLVVVTVDGPRISVDAVEIPGPRLLKLDLPGLRELAAGKPPEGFSSASFLKDCEVYIAVSCRPEEVEEAQHLLEHETDAVDWKIDPVGEEVEGRAAEAARERAPSAGEALKVWCGAQEPDPELASRAAALAEESLRCAR